MSLLSGVIKGSEICERQTDRGIGHKVDVACERHCDARRTH